MKFLFKAITTLSMIGLISIGAAQRSSAQFSTDATDQVQEFTVKIDKLGDATWEIATKMTQAQWENFKQGPLVNDPSISKRNLERAMSTYVIEDFNRTIDDMNRSVKMSCKIKAMAQYNGNGNWTFRLDSKNPQVTKLADNSYMLTSNIYYGTALTQQVFKVFFPDHASNIQQTTDSFGKAIFTYTYGGALSAMFAWNNIVGALLILAALGLFFVKTEQPLHLNLINVHLQIKRGPNPFDQLKPQPTVEQLKPQPGPPPHIEARTEAPGHYEAPKETPEHYEAPKENPEPLKPRTDNPEQSNS
jgi:hypothetical protein